MRVYVLWERGEFPNDQMGGRDDLFRGKPYGEGGQDPNDSRQEVPGKTRCHQFTKQDLTPYPV